MNAKQAEQVTGISRRNLRFYEQQGLIHPERNPDNDYRDYSAQDIEALKLIRMLRMLDTPLEDIAACLRKETSIEALSRSQEMRLRVKQKEVEASIEFCRKLQQAPQINADYIDGMLRQMDAPEVQGRLFDSWKQDYRKVAKAEREKVFTFTPDDAITSAAEFTAVLFRYANENGLELVITKEGLEPEFTMDGIEYTARRIYRRSGPVPVMLVRCTAVHPEELEPDVPGRKGKLMKFLHNRWLLMAAAGIWLVRAAAAEKPGEVLIAGGTLLLAVGTMYGVYRNYRN